MNYATVLADAFVFDELPVTEREVRRAFRSLGNTANQVASALDILGCRGSRDCEFCPLASFLELVFGTRATSIRVDGHFVFVGNGWGYAAFFPSRAIRNFVRKFDGGYYDQLNTHDEVL